MIRFALHALAVTLTCLPAVAHSQASCTLGAVAVLPLQSEHGHFDFTADVNGKSAKFLLDTGFFSTAFNLSSVARLGVTVASTNRLIYGVGGVQNEYRGRVGRMRIGNLNADHTDIVAVEMHRTVEDGGVDGMFGMNMMAAYDIDIDAVGKHAILYEADGRCSHPTVSLGPELYSAPLDHIRNDIQADVTVTVDGRRIKAMLDSGASHTALYRSAARRLGLDVSALNGSDQPTHHGIGPRAVTALRHVFPVVTIGDLQLNNVPVEILGQDGNGIDRHHVGSLLAGDLADEDPNGEEMLLGADFMSTVHVWISHSSHTLIMQYPPQASILPR